MIFRYLSEGNHMHKELKLHMDNAVETKKRRGIWRRNADSENEDNSQDQLQSYLQIAGPGIIIFIVSIFLLLAGFIVWSIFGRVETTMPITLIYNVNEDDPTYVGAYLTEDQFALVEEGMKVRTNSYHGVIILKMDNTVEFDNKTMNCILIVLREKPDRSEHKAEVILSEIEPISYLFN